MSTLERAARALHRRRVEGQHPKPENYPWEGLSRREQALLRVDAYAVIKALSEPSRHDLRKVEAYADEIDAHFDMSPEDVFKLVIEAILEDKDA